MFDGDSRCRANILFDWVSRAYKNVSVQIKIDWKCSSSRWAQGGIFKKDDVRIDGKIVVITGANTGIGKETGLDLAKRGGKIYLACRDMKKAEDARKEIVAKTGNQNVFTKKLDLSSFDSIREFAEEWVDIIDFSLRRNRK